MNRGARIHTGNHSDSTESSRRTREIEEFSNLYLIHPLAARLTPLLARMRVSPNAVSLGGMACGILAGWAYYHYRDLRYASIGFLLMAAWHVLDGADGQLARLTNRQSEFGKIIDGIADNVTFAAVYLGLGLSLAQTRGAWIWPVIVGAAIAHSLQAAAYEVQRQEYDFWGRNKRSAELKPTARLQEENRSRTSAQRLIFGLGLVYSRMQHAVARVDLRFRDKLADALAARPDLAPVIRRQYRKHFSSLVRAWSVMSSNYRTLAIFLCAALKVPLVYFLLELLGLTLLSAFMLGLQQTRCREFARYLDRQVS